MVGSVRDDRRVDFHLRIEVTAAMAKKLARGPRFYELYQSGRWDPCPCGYRYPIEDDVIGLRHHFNEGHYQKWKPEPGDDFEVEMEE